MFNLQITPRDDNPHWSNESIGIIELHKSFLTEMRERKPSMVDVVSNNGMFATNLNPADLFQGKDILESVRHFENDYFQNVSLRDLNRLIINVSGTSVDIIKRFMTALSLDIATIFDGHSFDRLTPDYLKEEWVIGHVFVEYEHEENKLYFKNLTIGGFITYKDERGKDNQSLYMRNYSGKTGDVFQGKPDELDKNIPVCRQVVKGNHLFSFVGNSTMLADGRPVKEIKANDFTNVQELFEKVISLGTQNDRDRAFGNNPHANVNTFVIDIAVPYLEGNEVKVSHITFIYLDNYQQLFLTGIEPGKSYCSSKCTTVTKLDKFWIENGFKLTKYRL